MMNENEIIVNEEVMEEPEVIDEKSGMNTGLAMLIGGVVTAAGIAGAKMLKRVWTAHKIKKETLSASDFEVVDDTDSESDVETE